MADLSSQQQRVVDHEGNVFVTACPGSGKTRVLTEKVVSKLQGIESTKHRTVAVTFTNRAADEIAARLNESCESSKQAWTGTIHAFALEWILRPYAGYVDELRYGFSVADEFYTRTAIDGVRTQFGIGRFDEIRTGYTRSGELVATAGAKRDLVCKYKEELLQNRLIDFDSVLFLAYELLQRRSEIPKTLAAIMKVICIDEYQDTQDLQYGILSTIVRASGGNSSVFIVGDRNQAIYSSLGGIAKTIDEVRIEFGLADLKHFELSGNYRSTQRIVDYCAHFRDDSVKIRSKAQHAAETGLVSFNNQDIDKEELAEKVAAIVKYHLSTGVRSQEICIVGPTWQLVTVLGRKLIRHLPGVDLDAPGLSPLRYQKDSVWFKLARLFLTEADPARYRSRFYFAGDFVRAVEQEIGRELNDAHRISRNILRYQNAIASDEVEGLSYLEDVFEHFMEAIEIDLSQYPELEQSRVNFFEGAKARLQEADYKIPVDIDGLKRMFRHPAGTVVNTCHGIKGEEYTTVICFGILRGYIPHWQSIFDDETDERENARRLLYVVSSRARKHLHLFAETGRQTQRGRRPYETSDELEEIEYLYDMLPE